MEGVFVRSHAWGHAVVPCLGPRSGPMLGATQWSHVWDHAVVPTIFFFDFKKIFYPWISRGMRFSALCPGGYNLRLTQRPTMSRVLGFWWFLNLDIDQKICKQYIKKYFTSSRHRANFFIKNFYLKQTLR